MYGSYSTVTKKQCKQVVWQKVVQAQTQYNNYNYHCF